VRIGSILKRTDGVIRFEKPVENRISVTFDDQKTDEEKIVQALVKGGVTVPEIPAPAP
jgi:copper chaperone CopZ